ncbi:unnamed protein product [Ceutorhynchus assimilis]|uniref:HTH psq-type domain-containing protein n=1 Tax=Ceutorhynchus assimilis TaxID=467358 RepID=A0A9N9MKB2_9CUCU|nr:unnamed protein product [Ceutorhynchus assimilis]
MSEEPSNTPEYGGFMTKCAQESHTDISSRTNTVYSPLLDMKPADHGTIYEAQRMPTQYKRKLGGKPRRQWRQEDLEEALRCLTSGEMGVNEASRAYGIPSRTLRRRRIQRNRSDLPLGPQAVLGTENEKRLVKHIQRLEKAGFAPDRETIRALAFQFAEKLEITHRFNRETGLAGYDWLTLFLKRNKELNVQIDFIDPGLLLRYYDMQLGANFEDVLREFDFRSSEWDVHHKAHCNKKGLNCSTISE